MTRDQFSYGITTTFEGTEAVLALSGRIEHEGDLILGAMLDAAIDHGPASMVLDLSALHWIGAAGLLAVVNAEKRLAEIGTKLTIRSPSALVNRLLGIMEKAETARL